MSMLERKLLVSASCGLGKSIMRNTPVIHARIVTLHLERCLGCNGIEDEMIVAVWAVLITRTGEGTEVSFRVD